MFKVMIGCSILVILIYGLFFSASSTGKWDQSCGTSFECGFSSYFFSRFSFSIHYFMVGMIFLFLDLEICLVLPFFNGEFDTLHLNNLMVLFVLALTLGLIYEWVQGSLEWKF